MKPSIPKGTRDFSSTEIARRDYIFDTIQEVFQNYGFQPIETPSFEKSTTLMGKYGDEGDRLIFKILNSGDYLKKVDPALLIEKDSVKTTPSISEKALRYDLTVPFARYVVQHQNEIVFPFKRYQMQTVWRADRPQKGRFREFYQCDADVVGSESLWQEVEFIQMYDEVFTKLGLTDIEININNRKILSGLAEIIGEKERIIDFTVALDKLDKIGVEGVKKEMISKNISEQAIKKIEPLFNFEGSNSEKIKQLKILLSDSVEGLKGIKEVEFVIEYIEKLGLQSAALKLEVTLARGLNYYTGAIFEVQTNKVAIGSIGGGGRYDDLTSQFGLKNISGIGISFGLDRIYLVLEELNLFTSAEIPTPKILFLNFGVDELYYCLEAIRKIRAKGINAEFYPDESKLKKQMNYANKRQIPFVVLVGERELNEGNYTLKNMNTGEQLSCNLKELVQLIST